MRYAIRTLWFERRRYLPGVLAVAFSGMLIAMQVSILMGLIGVVSVPIINSRADIWVAYPNTPACDLGRPMPGYWVDRLWQDPDVVSADEYVQGFTYWKTPSGASQLIVVVGCNLDDHSLGPIAQLTPRQRGLLTEPGAVILDCRDAHRLEVDEVGQTGEVSGQRVRVVGLTQNMMGITGPFVVCSLPTGRQMLRLREDQTTYLLAKTRRPENAPQVVARLRQFPNFSVFQAEEFSWESKMHWIAKTKAGIALGFAAVLGLAVGASVTSQTLYSATIASLRELAVLRALGIPRWRMGTFVIQQALLVGVIGLVVATPIVFALADLARSLGTNAVLPPWLLASTAAITLAMAMFSGLIALRSLRHAEPAQLLR